MAFRPPILTWSTLTPKANSGFPAIFGAEWISGSAITSRMSIPRRAAVRSAAMASMGVAPSVATVYPWAK